MSILHFQNFRRHSPRLIKAGWSQSDMAEFYRAHKLLNDHGILIGLDQGITDEHEPWLVFYDLETHDVFLHIARIDGTCVLICEHLSINIKEKQIDPLIRQFEYAVRNLLDTRSKQNSNVITHPAARIITTVAAVFLLFKMENSRAYANSHIEKPKSGQTDTDHIIAAEWRSGSTHRAHIIRIFETIDTPLHAAMMAGLIISNAIASQLVSTRGENSDFEFSRINNNDADLYLTDSNTTDIREYEPKFETYKTDENVIKLTSDNNTYLEYNLNPNYKPNFINIVSSNKVGMDNVSIIYTNIVHVDPDFSDSNSIEKGEFHVSKVTEPINTIMGNIKTDAVINIFNYLSAYVFDEDDRINITISYDSANLSFIQKDESNTNTNQIGVVDIADVHIENRKIGNVSIRDLDNLSENVEMYFETSLHYSDLSEMMRIIFSQFDGFEIEVHGGNLLVEQAHIDDSPYSDVGLWTNLMADGSEVSFIGSLNIIDDITAYMA